MVSSKMLFLLLLLSAVEHAKCDCPSWCDFDPTCSNVQCSACPTCSGSSPSSAPSVPSSPPSADALAHGGTHQWICSSAPCTKPEPPATVKASRFAYNFEGRGYEGYVAQPVSITTSWWKPAKLPIALVVHGMDGEGEYVQFRAEQLAQLGFVAFAVDLYGTDVRGNGDFNRGQQLVSNVYADMPKLHRQLAAQIDVLAAAFPADPMNYVVAGYCFGGNVALEMFRGNFTGLRASVSFHGTFMGANKTSYLRTADEAAVQLHWADEDFQDTGFVPNAARRQPSYLTEIEDELRAVGAERWTAFRYAKAGHAWTDPTSGAYKKFEAESAHDYSFALYRQLGLVPSTAASTPCAAPSTGSTCRDIKSAYRNSACCNSDLSKTTNYTVGPAL